CKHQFLKALQKGKKLEKLCDIEYDVFHEGAMNLTYFTNYSLRVMMYLGLNASSLTSISRISEAFAISRNHLIKVVHNLARQGFIKTVRGRGGGLRLARDPGEINLGDVVRKTEANF